MYDSTAIKLANLSPHGMFDSDVRSCVNDTGVAMTRGTMMNYRREIIVCTVGNSGHVADPASDVIHIPDWTGLDGEFTVVDDSVCVSVISSYGEPVMACMIVSASVDSVIRLI